MGYGLYCRESLRKMYNVKFSEVRAESEDFSCGSLAAGGGVRNSTMVDVAS